MRIQFDIKYKEDIISGKYKVFAGVIPARIICWDARSASGNDHIVAMVGEEGCPENILRFYSNGHLISDSANRQNKDLVIETGESEFEEAVKDFANDCLGIVGQYVNPAFIKDWTKRLFLLASKEIEQKVIDYQ